MGTITIKIPQNTNIEYIVNNIDLTEKIIEGLKSMKLTPSKTINDSFLGLFADEDELINYVTESAMQSRDNSLLRVP